MADLICEVADGLATITFNRPDRLNAYGGDIPTLFPKCLAQFDRDPEVRCILITGAEGSFCAGLDLKEENEADERKRDWLQTPSIPKIMLASNKPFVAAVPGAAIGIGFEIAMLCDYRIGSIEAKMGDRHVSMGLVQDCGAMITVPRTVGWANAAKILLSGDIYEAAELLTLGILNEVVEPEELQEAARSFTRRIAANAPLATQMTKRLLRMTETAEVDGVLAYAMRVMGSMVESEDSKEALTAFMEKRPPVFIGS